MAGLFPPQARDWSLPAEVLLTPRAACRVAREGATQSFDKAAAALNEDWDTSLDGKQIQRWSAALGGLVVARRAAEVVAYEQGQRPVCVANPPQLLVIGMDGGRVQSCEVNAQTGSRWREDKVAAITSYLPGNATTPPQPLVTSYVATMQQTEGFGALVHVEAERRGLRDAAVVLSIGDGGNWIDPLTKRERLCDQRIVDFFHAAEHLHDVATAIHGKGTSAARRQADHLVEQLRAGKVKRVIATLAGHARQLGPPRSGDTADHPRRVLANNVAYFTRHQRHMDYPTYEARGWPIGSGVTESAVKQFNKRVKGTDQFWREAGVEPILALRALWLSQDDRWKRHWTTRPAYARAA